MRFALKLLTSKTANLNSKTFSKERPGGRTLIILTKELRGSRRLNDPVLRPTYYLWHRFIFLSGSSW